MAPTTADTSRAAVIGGSLGGLTVALLLRDLGWHVTVYERSPVHLHGFGAGIVVHPTTLRYLVERAGIGVSDVSCGSAVVRTFDATGEVLLEEPSRHRFTSWTTVYRSLLAQLDPDHYCLGECLVGIDPAAEAVELRFASGRTDQAQLVVCADGISSTARRRLLGPIEPQYSGYVGWRGLISETDLSPATFSTLGGALTYGLGDLSHIVAYPVPNTDGGLEPGDRLLNYVWYRNFAVGSDLDELMTAKDGIPRPISLQPGQVQDRFVDDLRRDAAALLAPPLAEMVQRTPTPFLQVIVDLAAPRLAFGRVAIIGDAAFAARPHAAAGAAKAAADAWKLADAVGPPCGDVATALAAWEPAQLVLGRQLVERARSIGDRSQVHGTWKPGDPELRFGLYGPDR